MMALITTFFLVALRLGFFILLVFSMPKATVTMIPLLTRMPTATVTIITTTTTTMITISTKK